MSELQVIKQPNITCEEIVSTCTCSHCQQVFTNQNNLTRHINQMRCKVLQKEKMTQEIENNVTVRSKIESNNEIATILHELYNQIKTSQISEFRDRVQIAQSNITNKIAQIEGYLPPQVYQSLVRKINFDMSKIM